MVAHGDSVERDAGERDAVERDSGERDATARETLDRLDDALAVGDVETILGCYAPHAVYLAPDHGEIVGRDAIAAYVAEFATACPDMGWESVGRHDAGSVAIDEGIVTGTQTGPLRLYDGTVLQPTGRRLRFRWCDVAEVESGLIVSHRAYFDQVEILDQLGVAASRKRSEDSVFDDTV